jgi:hypothetical protein
MKKERLDSVDEWKCVEIDFGDTSPRILLLSVNNLYLLLSNFLPPYSYLLITWQPIDNNPRNKTVTISIQYFIHNPTLLVSPQLKVVNSPSFGLKRKVTYRLIPKPNGKIRRYVILVSPIAFYSSERT